MSNLRTKNKSSGIAALELYRTCAPARVRRPFSAHVSLLLDQAIVSEESAEAVGDYLAFLQHHDVRASLETWIFGGPDGAA